MTLRFFILPCPIDPVSQEVYKYYLLNIFQIHCISPTSAITFPVQALITSFLDIVIISHHESSVRTAPYLSHSLRSVTSTKHHGWTIGWMKRVLFLVLMHNLLILYPLSWMSFSLFLHLYATFKTWLDFITHIKSSMNNYIGLSVCFP